MKDNPPYQCYDCGKFMKTSWAMDYISCPKCGHRDADCWHEPTFHGLEMPYARIDELELIDSALAMRIRNAQPLRKGVLELVEEPFAYKYNVKSGFVRRRDFHLWKAFQWSQIPMEKPRARVKNQRRLLEATP